MTETEKMVQEINGLFRMTGDEELLIPKFESCASQTFLWL